MARSNSFQRDTHELFSPSLPWSARMANSVMQRNPGLDDDWNYTAGLVATGFEQIFLTTGDDRYLVYIKTYIDHLVDSTGAIRNYAPDDYNLDHINAGKVVFRLYQTTMDERYKHTIWLLREQLRHHPRTPEGGFWHKHIYPNQMWLDGLYMAAPFYAEFGATFDEPETFDDVAHQLVLVAQHARDSRTGLFYHAWDAARQQPWANPETGCSPHFWGRAMGWYIMALVDVLDYFPEQHPRRLEMLSILQNMVPPLATVQDTTTGLWYQILDQGSRPGNYLEASASGMFVYAIAKGVRKGYLDHQMLSIAEKGYHGILHHLIDVDADGLVNLHNTCQVAGLGKYKPDMRYRDGSFEYYISEPVITNDYKGVGAFILASVEMETLTV